MRVARALRRGWPLLLTFLLLLPTISYPLGWDQSVYAYIGWGVLHGYAPYKDAWAQNAPGNFFVYAAALRVLGETASSIAWLGLVENLAGAAAVMVAAHQLLGPRYAAPATLLFGVTSALGFEFWGRVEPEAAMAVAVTLMVVVLTAAQRSPRWAIPAWALAGALSACCALLKPTGAVAGVLALAIPMLSTGGLMRLPRLRWVMAFAVGGLVPVGAVTAYLAATGAIPEFYNQVIAYNVHYVGAGYANPAHSLAKLAAQTFMTAGPAPVLALFGAWVVLRRGVSEPGVRVLLGWAGLTFLGVAVQGSHHEYHHYFVLPAFSLLGAVAVTHWRDLVPRRRLSLYGTSAVMALYLGVVAALVGPRLVTYGAGIPAALGLLDRGAYLERFHMLSNDPRLRQPVGDYLQQATAPQDRIFVVGEAGTYFAAQRRAPTRLFQELPLWNTADPEPILAQLVRDLAADPPRYIVIHHRPEDFFYSEQGAILQAIGPLMRDRYAPDRLIERFELYRRSDG